MLQRIQTVYLLVIAALTVVLFFVPISESLALLGLAAASFAVSVASIFLYKNRQLQIRLCYINVVLFALMYAVTVCLQSVAMNVSFAIPAVNLVLSWLAIRSIAKDERLVRSLDRLR